MKTGEYIKAHPEDTLTDEDGRREAFFYRNDGYCVGYRAEGARKSAAAERWLEEMKTKRKIRIDWEPEEEEWDGDAPLPEDCVHECCTMRVKVENCSHCGSTYDHIEHLGSIAYYPGDNTVRLIEAQLALQAMGELEIDITPYLNRKD